MAGPVRRAGQAAFKVRVGLRPAAGAGATLLGPAGMDLEPRTRLPTPWERWDAGTEAAEGDEAGRRWLVASNGRQCLLNDGRDRVVVTTQVWSTLDAQGRAAAAVSRGFLVLVLVLSLVLFIMTSYAFSAYVHGLVPSCFHLRISAVLYVCMASPSHFLTFPHISARLRASS